MIDVPSGDGFLRRRNRKERRRQEAELRQEERNERSSKEQLALLDRRLGKGVGAKKERQRLRNN